MKTVQSMKSHYSIQRYNTISTEGSANFMKNTFHVCIQAASTVNQYKVNFQ